MVLAHRLEPVSVSFSTFKIQEYKEQVPDTESNDRGAYYWKRASRKEQIQVKMIVSEDGKVSEIVVQGDDQQIDEMRKELKLNEKDMVYVKGIFEK